MSNQRKMTEREHRLFCEFVSREGPCCVQCQHAHIMRYLSIDADNEVGNVFSWEDCDSVEIILACRRYPPQHVGRNVDRGIIRDDWEQPDVGLFDYCSEFRLEVNWPTRATAPRENSPA